MQRAESRVRGAVAGLDEALALGLASVSEWAAVWQSLLRWRWRLALAWAYHPRQAPGLQPSWASLF